MRLEYAFITPFYKNFQQQSGMLIIDLVPVCLLFAITM